MTPVFFQIRQFAQDEQGVTTIENALVTALTRMARGRAFDRVKSALVSTYGKVVGALAAA